MKASPGRPEPALPLGGANGDESTKPIGVRPDESFPTRTCPRQETVETVPTLGRRDETGPDSTMETGPDVVAQIYSPAASPEISSFKTTMEAAAQTGRQERGGTSGAERDVAEREVCLLTAAKVPAGHQKLIRGKISHQLDEGPLLFMPSLTDESVLLLDCVVEKGDDQFVTLVVENHGHTDAVRKGMRLGTVISVDLVPASEGNGGS